MPAGEAKTLTNVAASIKCQGADVQDLTPEEVAALHAMKHEMLAAVYRLYTKVNKNVAEPIVKKAIEDLLKDVDSEG